MTELKRIMLTHPGAISAASKPSKQLLREAERQLGQPLGPQLRDYLEVFGFITFGTIEFYGVTERNGLRSDMVTQTEKFHKEYSKVNGMFVLEALDAQTLILVDSRDLVYMYCENEDALVKIGMDVDTYMLDRVRKECSSWESQCNAEKPGTKCTWTTEDSSTGG